MPMDFRRLVYTLRQILFGSEYQDAHHCLSPFQQILFKYVDRTSRLQMKMMCGMRFRPGFVLQEDRDDDEILTHTSV
jgi:hypothetical protein